MGVVGSVLRGVVNMQVRGKSVGTLIQAMETGGQDITALLANKPDTPRNRRQVRHVIGMERWGQRRLHTVLGEPAIKDEYDGYQPADGLDLAALRAEWADTRASTLRLTRTLHADQRAATGKANHNSMGDMTVPAWLHYLTVHAKLETGRMD